MENEMICFFRRFERLPKETYWQKLGTFKALIENYECDDESARVYRVACKMHKLLCKKYIEKFC